MIVFHQFSKPAMKGTNLFHMAGNKTKKPTMKETKNKQQKKVTKYTVMISPKAERARERVGDRERFGMMINNTGMLECDIWDEERK